MHIVRRKKIDSRIFQLGMLTCNKNFTFLNQKEKEGKKLYIFQMNKIRHTSKFSFFLLSHEKLLLNFFFFISLHFAFIKVKCEMWRGSKKVPLWINFKLIFSRLKRFVWTLRGLICVLDLIRLNSFSMCYNFIHEDKKCLHAS